MGKHVDAPPAPDYTGAAIAQGASSAEAARQQAITNNPNINTPYGSQTVDWTPDGQAYINQYLNPTAQAALTQQQQADLGLSTLANQQTGNISNILNSPFSFGGTPQTSLPSGGQTYGRPDPTIFNNRGGGGYGTIQESPDLSGVAKAPIDAGTTAQQAIMSRLQPQLDRQRTSTETQLVNQGLRPGSEAYDNSIRDLGQQENDARQQAVLSGLGLDMSANQQGYGQALGLQQAQNAAQGQGFGQLQGMDQSYNSAVNQNFANTLNANQFGNQLQQQQFNQGLQGAQFGNTALQQQLAQQLQLRDQPLNEITGLMSGSQIQNPQFSPYQGGGMAQPTNYLGAAQSQGAFDQNTYNQKVAQRNALTQGLFSLGGAGIGLL